MQIRVQLLIGKHVYPFERKYLLMNDTSIHEAISSSHYGYCMCEDAPHYGVIS